MPILQKLRRLEVSGVFPSSVVGPLSAVEAANDRCVETLLDAGQGGGLSRSLSFRGTTTVARFTVREENR